MCKGSIPILETICMEFLKSWVMSLGPSITWSGKRLWDYPGGKSGPRIDLSPAPGNSLGKNSCESHLLSTHDSLGPSVCDRNRIFSPTSSATLKPSVAIRPFAEITYTMEAWPEEDRKQ